MKRLILVGLALAMAVSFGCAINLTPRPFGGSKADGTVLLAYEFGMFQTPHVNWTMADHNAVSRCKAWGYTDASKFDTGYQQCLIYSDGMCSRYRVTVTYQCTE